MTKSTLLSATASPWKLELFEKEKGGVGSTGSLVTAAHHVIMRGGDVTFIEASTTQNDILNAYEGHHSVYAVDLTETSARDQIIDAVTASPPGASIFVNVPGGRAEELDRVHELVHFVLEDGGLPIECAITWTMGLDAASRSTLDMLLQTNPPGRLKLNLPAWHGKRDKFVTVDDDLVAEIEAGSGLVFQMPALEVHVYDLFRTGQLALDRIREAPEVSTGSRFYFGMWERNVRTALAGIY